MPSSVRTAVLFDIDLTLLDFAADHQVLRDVLATFTDDPAVQSLDPTGRSDRWVISALARSIGTTAEELLPRYEAAYHAHLEAALERDGVTPLPGVRPLLEHLATLEAVTLGIATGNLRRNAALKLRHTGLDGFFAPLLGGFGEDGTDRRDIVARALEDCRPHPRDRAVVVGDTPRDIDAARTNGVAAIAVATGRYSADELRRAEPDAVLLNLEDRNAALAAILPR